MFQEFSVAEAHDRAAAKPRHGRQVGSAGNLVRVHEDRLQASLPIGLRRAMWE